MSTPVHLPDAAAGSGAFVPLVSARLTLRAMTVDDAADLAQRRSDPETARFQSWTAPYPLDRAVALIDSMAHLSGPTPGEWFQVSAVETATGKIVGDVAAALESNGRTAQIGYTLHPWARHQGFATESAARLIDHLVTDLNVHRIDASTDPRNLASNRVLERLGFTLEGVKVESYWLGDTVTDDAMWGLLARNWAPPK